MTDSMKAIQTEIAKLKDRIETLVHVFQNNAFIHTDLERIRNSETEFAIGQTIQYLGHVKFLVEDLQAHTSQSQQKIHELAAISTHDSRLFKGRVTEELRIIRAELSRQTNEEVRNTNERVLNVLEDVLRRES